MLANANTSRFLFDCPGGGVDWRVVGVQAETALSTAYWCELELVCTESDVDLVALVGKAGVLTLFDTTHPVCLHGEIAAATQGAVGKRFTTYHLSLRPKLWQLELRSGLRIFQDQSVPDIVKQVLEEAGISGKDVRFEHKRTYPPRTYCTQYRESDFAFINRLLAEEGLFYFFDHSIERHVLVIGDDNGSFKPVPGTATLPYTPAAGMVTSEQAVVEFSVQQQLRTASVMLRDYVFEKPSLLLESQSANGRFSALQHYDYPGGFADNGLGRQLVESRLHSEQSNACVISGRSDSQRLQNGMRFTLSKHPRKDFNTEYLLTHVRLQGRQPQSLEEGASSEGSSFSLDFQAIPADSAYRAVQRYPRPRIEGVQTAFVTGPKGEEIYTDAHGRIKVQFHWDREGKRDETSSCWLRVAQAWAGNQWGSFVLPRVGQEVLVTFLDGDPDRPLVTGALYNATTQPPYLLPASKTRTTFKSQSTPGGGGFNELRIEDKKGSEQLFVHAQKDANLHVGNDWKQSVDHDSHLTVQKNAVESVGQDVHVTIGEHRYVKTGAGQSLAIGGDQHIKIGSNQLIKAGRELHWKGGQTVVLEAGLSMTLKAGSGKIVLDPSGVAIIGSKVRINSGGGGGSAKAAAPAAPSNPAKVDPGKPGSRISLGRSNKVFKVEPIPFATGAVGRVRVGASSPSLSSVSQDAMATPNSEAGGTDRSGSPRAVRAAVGSEHAAPAVSNGLPATAKRVAGGNPLAPAQPTTKTADSLFGAVSDVTVFAAGSAASFAGGLQEKAGRLAKQSDDLVEKAASRIEQAKDQLLDTVKSGVTAIVPESLQDLLDSPEEDDFDFSE
ncbi:MAG: type VI secretion system tip protein VgrG [Gammaproteobacteria bacterium]